MTEHDVARIFTEKTPAARSEWIRQAVANTGRSASYWYEMAKRGGWSSGRGRRSDSGAIRANTSEDEILKVARLKIEGTRANGKQITSTDYAASMARGGMIDFDSSAPGVSTYNRQLRLRGLGRQQLKRVRIKKRKDKETGEIAYRVSEANSILCSDHPNQVHHVDTSICVIWSLGEKKDYQLKSERSVENLIYKNKPDRMVKALKLGKRIIRYVLADHCSGAIYFRYYESGGENAADMFDFLFHAWRFKEWMPFRGAPDVLFSDAGAGLDNNLIQNALQSLDIRWIAADTGSKEANGAAEVAQNVVELKFESLLRFQEIPSLEHLNAQAEQVCAYINNVHVHSRLKAPRSAVWSMIPAEKLREIPDDLQVWQRLADLPAARKVTMRGEISFDGMSFRTDNHELAGQEVTVFYNPYKHPDIDILHQRTGYRATLEPIPVNAFGRRITGANVARGTFDRPADSATVLNVKRAMQQDTSDVDSSKLVGQMGELAADRSYLGGAKQGEKIEIAQTESAAFDNTIQAKKYLVTKYGRPGPGVLSRVFELLPTSGITIEQAEAAWQQVTAGNTDQESHHAREA